MKKQHKLQINNITYQLKLPVEISTIIEISDPVYTFCEVMDCIDLKKYLAAKESKTGRKRYNPLILLKVILFAFMEYGYVMEKELLKNVILEISMISCGFNLHKYHLKSLARQLAA